MLLRFIVHFSLFIFHCSLFIVHCADNMIICVYMYVTASYIRSRFNVLIKKTGFITNVDVCSEKQNCVFF
jgi:hypothetical protein